jgi:hypothetical protein
VVGNKNIPIEKGESLDQAILGLIHETWAWAWLEGLLSFENKLSKSERQLTPSEISLIINKVKQDIQNPEFLSFESWRKDDKDFWFEWVGTDVIPTLSPNWDCIVPVNFWYDWQRRTILLIIEVSPDGEETVYRLPEWDNHYSMKINDVEFTYQLVKEGKCFKMKFKNN